MRLKPFIFKLTVFLAAVTGISTISYAQDSSGVSKSKWWRPAHIKTQFAGNIGFLSGGVGFTDKKKRSAWISSMDLSLNGLADWTFIALR